ncbi:endonuclease/exonuclease/phosphatase family protein [Halobacteriovorax sp. HLS]|uniref:endonuclease/exonuclease/phosphatase family protein n=1 Tax=Halobacteriovorax sp. HLS TaxID=2234000 RepID=UPI000FD9FC05|nr:endonuclease/exonuclease/phosphatase family protein [Halobacteriovorax sp. HLS]
MITNTRMLLVALACTLSIQSTHSFFSFGRFKTPPLDEMHLVRGKAKRTSLNPDNISILVWNIYKGKNDSWREDFPELSKDRDLLLIQETDSDLRVQNTLEKMKDFRWDTGISFTYSKKVGSFTGTLIGSKVEPKKVDVLRSKYKEPLVRTHKVITSALYPIEGKSESLLAITIHAINFARKSAFYHQLRQTESMIRNHKGPVVFGGDFNCRSKKKTLYMRNFFKELGFNEVTFRNDNRYRSGMTGRIIDYIFVRDLKVLDSEVYGHLKSSDHMAMSVDLAY